MVRHGPPGWSEEYEQAIRQRAKQELRRQMKSLRNVLPREVRAARAETAAEHVVRLQAYRDARTVLAFVPVRAEIDPARITDAARSEGKRLALPRVDFDTMELRLHRWEADDALEPGGYGIPEPLASAPEVPPHEVDFVLVPALAVDVDGYRVGYGKGFYDRLLPTLPRAVRCALVYDFQILAEAPRTAGDVPVHVIASDSRVIMVGG